MWSDRMSTSPASFRDEYDKCAWIFDLFAHGYDFMNGEFFPRSDSLDEAWSAQWDEIERRKIIIKLVRADGEIPEEVKEYLNIPGGDSDLEEPGFRMRLFCALAAIDDAAADLNYLGSRSRMTYLRWPKVTQHFQTNKQLQRYASGHVVFKPRYIQRSPSETWWSSALKTRKWTQIPERGEEFAGYFDNLLRVSPRTDCRFDFRIVGFQQDFQDDLDWTSLKLGIVPLVEELKVHESHAQLLPGPLIIKRKSIEPSSFEIQIDESSGRWNDLCDRAEAGLRYLAEQQCQIVLFPEMVVPDPVVARIQQVLKNLANLGRPRPGLTIAGTFTRIVPRYDKEKPFNVAIALNHRGEELWRQRKTQPYDMQRYEQRIFGLESILDSNSCRENIQFAHRKLRFVDSVATGLRMAILICEDATRDPGLRSVREFYSSLTLSPVMAGPLEGTTGFAAKVDDLLRDVPGIFIVANSAALARAAKKESPSLAIVGLPLLDSENHRAFQIVRKFSTTPGTSPAQVLVFQFPT
jgi:hypothetical protein